MLNRIGKLDIFRHFTTYHPFAVGSLCDQFCIIVQKIFKMCCVSFPAENVNEYLRLSAVDDSSVDRQQAHRVKAAFEKRNQKSTQTIAQLQRKLEMYTGRLRELEETGILYPGGNRQPHRQARTVLKDVGQGIRLTFFC